MGSPQAHETGAGAFWRADSGAGLGIQGVARRQPTPRRASGARIVSPVTRVAGNPVAQLTAAASSKGQMLVSLPKTRGLWCSSARKRSAAGAKAA
jgi:hypothetical protein